ncbi:hypothetical protein KPZU09_61780 [Klebsiella pneumoniae]|uniref:DhaL domain-containing protein n=1 Tax=Klebsiella pneumoniae TaxID=573 RepID=A0A919M2A8_KLEPN|nr:hypothetical protein KPZU09_61780 [Klebsiella pneumoniae]
MSIFFTAAGQKLGQGASVAEALNAGLEQMKFYGGADEGDRTMIDALQPATAALLAEPENLQAAFAAAQAGADRTCQSSKAGAGRASYLNSESLLGNMDPAPTRWRWCLRRWRNAKPSPVALRLPGRRNTAESRSGKA